jgi:hypothetical protein
MVFIRRIELPTAQASVVTGCSLLRGEPDVCRSLAVF